MEKVKKDEQKVKIWNDVEAKRVANKKEITDYTGYRWLHPCGKLHQAAGLHSCYFF